MKKRIAILLIAAMIIGILAGCGTAKQTVQKLSYSLDQQMIKGFYDLLEQTESFCIDTSDLTQAEEKLDQLDRAYLELMDQYQIAYINYCLDQSDQDQKQLYMDCVDITTAAETSYNQMCKRLYLSDSPIRDGLFADWTDEEIDRMLKRNDEIANLEKRNTQITVEFRELDDAEESWAEEMVVLYNEMVSNHNRIAQIYGYDNYYDYASQVICDRDYGREEIQKMRQYVAMYLPETYLTALDQFYESYEELNVQDRALISRLLMEPYDQLDKNYVMAYLQVAPEPIGDGIMDMFDSNRVIFADAPNAYEGAFTTWIGGKPFCFYGPGYTDTLTLLHEGGHYYGCSYTEPWSQPMDLSETQSQCSEWLFVRHLQQQVSPEVYQAIAEYQLLTSIGNIISYCIIDGFEQMVYSSDSAGNMTLQEYEVLMASVSEDYGGIQWLTENIMDIQLYWKYVVLESPVYYISYAVSGIAAIDLFTIAEEDFQSASEIYIKLIEQPQEGEAFLGNIRWAGLAGPFEETVYQRLQMRYAKESKLS